MNFQKRFRHPSSEAQTAGDEMVGEVMRKNSGAGGEMDAQRRCIYMYIYIIYIFIYLSISLFIYLFIIYLFIYSFIHFYSFETG